MKKTKSKRRETFVDSNGYIRSHDVRVEVTTELKRVEKSESVKDSLGIELPGAEFASDVHCVYEYNTPLNNKEAVDAENKRIAAERDRLVKAEKAVKGKGLGKGLSR